MAQAAAATPEAPKAHFSRAARVRQVVVSFAVVVGCYWLYWLLAVPLIEPGLEESPLAVASEEQIDEARGDVSARQRELAQYFSAEDWEANQPAIWQSGEMRLLFKTISPQPDGTVELRPCTLMFFPKKNGAASLARPVIMRTEKGANVRFDKPIDLARPDPNRKFLGGELLGSILIYRQPTAPGADDDVEITTSQVRMSADRAWTDQPVKFRFGRSTGSGRDLEILLGPKPGERKVDVIKGATFRTLILKRDVRMRLEMNPGSPPADGNPPGAPETPEPPIAITCQGPFVFEMEQYLASFREKVDVFRLNPDGESDQLNCALLKVYFARPGETLPEPTAPEQGGENRALSTQVRLIEARGDPVTLRSPARGLFARSKGIDYVPGAPGSPGSLAAFGPGVIYGDLPNDPAGKYVAQWARELRFEPDGPLERATLRGATVLQIGQMGTITADEVFAWLSRKPQPPDGQAAAGRAQNGAINADDWQLERVLARRYQQTGRQSQGNVVIDSPQLHAVAETLEATVAKTPAAPGRAAPAAPANRQPPARRQRQQPQQQTEERFEVSGRHLHVHLVPRGKELAVAGATIEHDAKLEQFSTTDRKRQMFVRGHRLHVADAHTDNAKVTIAGNPGYVEAAGMTLWGAVVHLARRDNHLWIRGPGQLTMPITQDLDGKALEAPQALSVDWKAGMDFRSDTAVFEGTVVARSEQQRLDTEKLEAVLTRAVDFADPVAAAPGRPDQAPELATVRTYGRTLLASRQFENGVQTATSRMQLTDLSVDRTSGKIAGRGPGWVKHVAKGAAPPLLAPGQQPAARAAAAAANAGQQLTYLYVTFRQGIDGNINRRTVRFFDSTKTVYGPINHWNATLDGNDPDTLGPQGMTLEAAALEVREMNRRPNSKRGWFELEATGGVVAEGQRFTAMGNRLTYTEEKEGLILRGDPAQIFLENESDGSRTETRHGQVGYWFRRHYASSSGSEILDLMLHGESQQRLFEGLQPKPPAARPR